VVVVIMVVIVPKPRRTPGTAQGARRAVEEETERCITFFRDWDPICGSAEDKGQRLSEGLLRIFMGRRGGCGKWDTIMWQLQRHGSPECPVCGCGLIRAERIPSRSDKLLSGRQGQLPQPGTRRVGKSKIRRHARTAVTNTQLSEPRIPHPRPKHATECLASKSRMAPSSMELKGKGLNGERIWRGVRGGGE
jgi:hypothetical protein